MKSRNDRRAFLRESLTGVAVSALTAARPRARRRAGAGGKAKARIRFAAIGLNHGHINGQTEAVIRGGGELVAFYAPEDDLAAAYSKRFPQAKRAREEREILEDPEIKLVVSAVDRERARPARRRA